jgi:predicted nucleic acid-binding protein
VGEVEFYLDTSFLVALLISEPFTDRAEGFTRSEPTSLIVSDFAAAEFASAVSRRVRTQEYTLEQGRTALTTFDNWVAGASRQIDGTPIDIAVATTFLRRLDLPLKTPDAIHIAIAQRSAPLSSPSTGKWPRTPARSEHRSRHRKHCPRPRKCAILWGTSRNSCRRRGNTQ